MVAPNNALAGAKQAKERHNGGACHARGPTSAGHFLNMDAAIGLGQQGPGNAVGQQANAKEECEHHGQAADNDGVNAPFVGQAAAHAAHPAVGAALHAQAAKPLEELGGFGLRCGGKRCKSFRVFRVFGGRGRACGLFWGVLGVVHASIVAAGRAAEHRG